MKKLAFLAVFSMLFSALAVAKDEYLYLDLKSALNDPKVKAAIPSNVSFKFGKGSGAGAKIILKDIVSNKRTNGVGKSDEDSCRWALAAALKAFGERALKEGGSKVVNLTGYFRKQEYNSNDKFQCVAGNIMSAVTLRGRYR